MRRILYTASSKPTRLPMKAIKFMVGLVVGSIIFILMAFLFVYIAIFVAAFLGYLWWKTRALRKNLCNAAQSNAPQGSDLQGGFVIEGEVIRETEAVPAVLMGEESNMQSTDIKKHRNNV